jgi:hypothetical protein
MQIIIKHYGHTFVWENEYGTHGIGQVKIDETDLTNAIETFAALLVAAGWSEKNIKDVMYDYGRTELPEEI